MEDIAWMLEGLQATPDCLRQTLGITNGQACMEKTGNDIIKILLCHKKAKSGPRQSNRYSLSSRCGANRVPGSCLSRRWRSESSMPILFERIANKFFRPLMFAQKMRLRRSLQAHTNLMQASGEACIGSKKGWHK